MLLKKTLPEYAKVDRAPSRHAHEKSTSIQPRLLTPDRDGAGVCVLNLHVSHGSMYWHRDRFQLGRFGQKGACLASIKLRMRKNLMTSFRKSDDWRSSRRLSLPVLVVRSEKLRYCLVARKWIGESRNSRSSNSRTHTRGATMKMPMTLLLPRGIMIVNIVPLGS